MVNGTVGERRFDFRKSPQVQLPDLKALFKEIDENQKPSTKSGNYAARIRRRKPNSKADAG